MFTATQGPVAATRGASRSHLSLLAPWALALAAGVVALVLWRGPAPEPPLRRFDLTFGPVAPAAGSEVVVSPDGTVLAFSGRVGNESAIYLRHLDGDPDFRKVAGAEERLQVKDIAELVAESLP